MAAFYENWLRTHADTSDVGCDPILEKNWTCPKWNKKQPGVESALDYLGAATPGVGIPNCYICCSGRPGFGCTPNTPKDFVGSVADVIPFDVSLRRRQRGSHSKKYNCAAKSHGLTH